MAVENDASRLHSVRNSVIRRGADKCILRTASGEDETSRDIGGNVAHLVSAPRFRRRRVFVTPTRPMRRQRARRKSKFRFYPRPLFPRFPPVKTQPAEPRSFDGRKTFVLSRRSF